MLIVRRKRRFKNGEWQGMMFDPSTRWHGWFIMNHSDKRRLGTRSK